MKPTYKMKDGQKYTSMRLVAILTVSKSRIFSFTNIYKYE